RFAACFSPPCVTCPPVAEAGRKERTPGGERGPPAVCFTQTGVVSSPRASLFLALGRGLRLLALFVVVVLELAVIHEMGHVELFVAHERPLCHALMDDLIGGLELAGAGRAEVAGLEVKV